MHVKVHLKTAAGAAWTIPQFMPLKAEYKLSAAQDASEALLSGFHVAVFIDCFRGASRTLKIEHFPRNLITYHKHEIIILYVYYTSIAEMLIFG